MADRRVGRARKTGQIAAAVIVSLLALFLLTMAVVLLFSDMPGLSWFFAALGLFLSALTWWIWSTLLKVWKSWVAFDADAFRAHLPSWRGLFRTGPMRDIHVPYPRIRAIEQRDEIYRFLFIPSLLTAYTLVTDMGERICFGIKSDLADDLDFAGVAATLAERAAVPINDLGVVEGTGIFGFRLRRPSLDAASLPSATGQRERALARAVLQLAFLLMALAGAIKACAEM